MIHILVKILIILFSLALPIWAIFYYGRVRIVSCYDVENNPCPQAIWAEFQNLIKEPLLLVQSQDIKTRFSQKFLTYELKDLSLIYPHIVTLVIQPLSPVAILRSADSSQYLSKNGVVLSGIASSLPVIYQANPVAIQTLSYDDPLIRYSLKLIHELQTASLSVQEIVIHDANNLEVIFADKIKAIFSPQQAITDQVSTLQRILLTTTMRKDQLVDIRYDIPVIKETNFSVSVATESASPSGSLKEEGT